MVTDKGSVFQKNNDLAFDIDRFKGQVSPKLVQELDLDGDNIIDTSEDPDDDKLVESPRDDYTPTQIDRLEIDPISVTRLGGTLPWVTESMQLQCGETVVGNNGDNNLRLVMEMIITDSQFVTLQQMRNNSSVVKLISRSYTGPVTFDEMKFERIPDSNGAIIEDVGETYEPQYKIHLQTKESEADGVGVN